MLLFLLQDTPTYFAALVCSVASRLLTRFHSVFINILRFIGSRACSLLGRLNRTSTRLLSLAGNICQSPLGLLHYTCAHVRSFFLAFACQPIILPIDMSPLPTISRPIVLLNDLAKVHRHLLSCLLSPSEVILEGIAQGNL